MGRWSALLPALSRADTADTADTKGAPGSANGVCVRSVRCVTGVEKPEPETEAAPADTAEAEAAREERLAIEAERRLPPPGSPERQRLDAKQARTVAGLLHAARWPAVRTGAANTRVRARPGVPVCTRP